MARINVRLPSLNSVPAGGVAGTATLRLPIGRRYHYVYLVYSGVTLAQMTEIRVYANGKAIQTFTAALRDSFNQFDGLTAAGGILTIPFDRQNLLTLAAEEETALNTGSVNKDTGYGISDVYIEIDISSAASGAVLSAFAEVSDSLPGGPGTVLHIRRDIRSAAGAGEFQVPDISVGSNTTLALNRVWFVPSANDISNLIISRNNYTIFERSKTLNARIQTDGVRVPQSGIIAIDKTERGFGGDPINLLGVNDYRYILTATGALTCTMYHEFIGQLGD